MLGIVVCGAMIYGLGWTNWLRLIAWLAHRPASSTSGTAAAQQAGEQSTSQTPELRAGRRIARSPARRFSARGRSVSSTEPIGRAQRLDGARVAAATCERRAAAVARAPAAARPRVSCSSARIPASEIYVREQGQGGRRIGRPGRSRRACPRRRRSTSSSALVDRLNRSAEHDGILVQSPLPAAMGRDAAQRVFDAIDPAKDVDGFNPVNVGRLAQGRPHLAPCTPSGVMEMLDHFGIAIGGARAVVIGRSDIVGKPMALLLLRRDATVTICHSKTPAIAAVTAEADIVVAAIGRAGFVTREFVKPGATVIDVGINRVTERAAAAALLRRGLATAGRVRSAGLGGRRRRASGSRGGGRRAHAGAWRRRAADDRDAAEEHGDGSAREPTDVVQAALTGGIATGKSYCLARLAALGVPTIDADKLARLAVAPGSPGLAAVVAALRRRHAPRGRHARSPGAGAHHLRRPRRPRRPRGDRPPRRLSPDPRLVRAAAADDDGRASPTFRCCSRRGTSTTSTR